jgi:phosphoglycolate phosphatase
MISNIFFDLDGTLTDSKEGIIKCYQYALGKLNYAYQSEILENSVIGPPLRVTFRRFLNTNDEALIENAVAIYRERFSTIGLFENKVYPGIPEMLSSLHKKSFKLYVVTSKAKIYADRIIEHFQLSTWFNDVYGSDLGGRFDNKADLITFILNNRKLRVEETVMIGDKKEDIMAGKANRTRTIGVTYGYGTKGEISDAAPDYICGSPSEIQKLVMKIR